MVPRLWELPDDALEIDELGLQGRRSGDTRVRIVVVHTELEQDGFVHAPTRLPRFPRTWPRNYWQVRRLTPAGARTDGGAFSGNVCQTGSVAKSLHEAPE